MKHEHETAQERLKREHAEELEKHIYTHATKGELETELELMNKKYSELEDKLRVAERANSGTLTKADLDRMKAEVEAHFEHVPHAGDEDAQNALFDERFKSLG